MSTKCYRPWAPDQPYLLPPRPRDWLGKGHLAYFILDVVDELDLSEIEDAIHAKDPRGNRPFPPQMMVALLLYAYAVGVFSSRRIARGTYDDLAMRFITGDNHPAFTTIAAFRRIHLVALGRLFVQAVKLCQAAGLVNLGHVSLDGTKIQANASKHKAMSYDRMTKKETQLQDEIVALLAKAERADTAEDALHGEGVDGHSLPEELRRRKDRLAKIRAAKKALEKEAKVARAETLREQQARHEETAASHPDPTTRKRAATHAKKREAAAEDLEEASGDQDEDSPDGPPESPSRPNLPHHRPKTEPDGTPKPKAQRNFTDPDSRIMKGKSGAFEQAYNTQIAVDDEHQIIVGLGVSNQAPDTDYLVPVMTHAIQTVGATPQVFTADAGYWSPSNAEWCEAKGMEAYIAVGRERCEQQPTGPTEGPPTPAEPQPPDRPPPPPDSAVADELNPNPPPKKLSPKEQMAAKIKTERGREMYRQRKHITEPVFGQIKEARGFRRFLLRGMGAVQQEWALVCTAHNLLKLFRASPEGELALPEAG